MSSYQSLHSSSKCRSENILLHIYKAATLGVKKIPNGTDINEVRNIRCLKRDIHS